MSRSSPSLQRAELLAAGSSNPSSSWHSLLRTCQTHNDTPTCSHHTEAGQTVATHIPRGTSADFSALNRHCHHIPGHGRCSAGTRPPSSSHTAARRRRTQQCSQHMSWHAPHGLGACSCCSSTYWLHLCCMQYLAAGCQRCSCWVFAMTFVGCPTRGTHHRFTGTNHVTQPSNAHRGDRWLTKAQLYTLLAV